MNAAWFASKSLQRLGMLTGLICAATVCAAAAETPESAEPVRAKMKVLREGTKLQERAVQCISSGERLIIDFDNGPQQITALENLASQRILDALYKNPSDKYWVVTGLATEFRNKNFVQLLKVNRSSAAKKHAVSGR